jgi:hypothetical protein
MDYKTLKDRFEPYIKNGTHEISKVRSFMNSTHSNDAFDNKVLVVLKNILETFEAAEYMKSVVRDIFNSNDFFTDESVHHTTKKQHFKEILNKNNYIELNKQFNLGILQTYMADILNKQLLEINIKIEENQRILDKLLNAKKEQKTTVKETKKTTIEETRNLSKYLIVENERTSYSIKYDKAIELLKVNKRTADKFISEQIIPYGQLIGLTSRNVIKKIIVSNIPKNQPLYNLSYKLNNTVDKGFAIITKKENLFNVLFVDSIKSVEPVEAEDLGDYAKTFEGNIKTIEV